MTDVAQIRAELSSVPEVPRGNHDAGILGAYHGQKPEYPHWALAALAVEPERSIVAHQGVNLEVLSWGKPTDPAVILMHGNGASADWWVFTAPALARAGYQVIAFSFSGMGGSDWRATYQMDDFVGEILTIVDAFNLTARSQRPTLIGHSFGGFPAIMVALQHRALFHSLIMLDSGIEPPGEEWTGPPKRTSANRVFASLPEGLGRFRLAPPQSCDNHWALDYIARTSLKEVEGGWTWKFDPFLWNDFTFAPMSAVVSALDLPTIAMRGSQSYLMADRIWDYMKSILPPNTGYVTIPEAAHHVMLDQPLATLAALEAALAGLSILPKATTQG